MTAFGAVPGPPKEAGLPFPEHNPFLSSGGVFQETPGAEWNRLHRELYAVAVQSLVARLKAGAWPALPEPRRPSYTSHSQRLQVQGGLPGSLHGLARHSRPVAQVHLMS